MNEPFAVASAPGRLDVMGGIADYSGSLVLQLPIRQNTTVKFSQRKDFLCTITSETSSHEIMSGSIDYRRLLLHGEIDYFFARQKLSMNPNDSWMAYIIGCALVLQKEKGIQFGGGDFQVQSDVPIGKGVSSSASLEVATMKVLAQVFGITFSRTELPVLAQRVENLIVGAPCGLMDQLTCYLGSPGKLLPILCQPDKVYEPVEIPQEISFIGIDSGIRHYVGGTSYGDVRCAAFMGYSVIIQSMGVSQSEIQQAKNKNDFSSLPFGGYLCNIPIAEFEKSHLSLLPEKMKGKEFLRRYGLTIDHVTDVNENVEYEIRQCTSHPVYENARVNEFMNLLKNKTLEDKQINTLGKLMYESHESYSRCGLGCKDTDEIVDLVKSLQREGVAGAKITGGGSGGTVCILAVGDRGKQTVKKLHQQLSTKHKKELILFE
jgi:L-arabinokinase